MQDDIEIFSFLWWTGPLVCYNTKSLTLFLESLKFVPVNFSVVLGWFPNKISYCVVTFWCLISTTFYPTTNQIICSKKFKWNFFVALLETSSSKGGFLALKKLWIVFIFFSAGSASAAKVIPCTFSIWYFNPDVVRPAQLRTLPHVLQVALSLNLSK